MLSRFSHVRLYLRDPMDCTAPGSSVHGILQARTLEWAAMPPLGLPDPRGPMLPVSPGLAGMPFIAEPPGSLKQRACTPLL